MPVITTIAGAVQIATDPDPSIWQIQTDIEDVAEGVQLVHVRLTAAEPAPLPEVRFNWRFPLAAVRGRWNLAAGLSKNLPLDWFHEFRTSTVMHEPALTLFGHDDANVLSFALAEAVRTVRFLGGGDQFDGSGHCRIVIEAEPAELRTGYDCVLRLDLRKIFYADAVRDQARWLGGFAPPLPTPAAAFAPDYDTWYSLCKRARRDNVEAEAALAAELGFGTLTMDLGWAEDDDTHRYGTFTLCGVWENHPERFPAMAEHVARVHELGLKYVLWCGFPFVGVRSEIHARFAGRYLRSWSHPEAGSVEILDPRFPEVRRYIIDTLCGLVTDWKLDGLKLDMLDCYTNQPNDARVEPGDGRDIPVLSAAVRSLLEELRGRLQVLNSELLIEFRQAYDGFAMRRFGNLFRVADCGGDWQFNRVSVLDMRLATDGAAVHSDPLLWRPGDAARDVALQMIAVLWGVPQLSVMLAEQTAEQQAVLRHWLGFCNRHRATIFHGRLTPCRPEANYPLVYGEDANCRIATVYVAETVVEMPHGTESKTLVVINGAGDDGVWVSSAFAFTGTVYDYRGETLGPVTIPVGATRIAIPAGGLLSTKTEAAHA